MTKSEFSSDVSSTLTALASLLIDWIVVIGQQGVDGHMAGHLNRLQGGC
jgi:hypothetical protein